MQTKVSMVIPIYNKANYIDRMFQSVYDQKYDNIEVILSIRKSDDGTDNKVQEWIPKLSRRGYTVVCIYGENKSLPTGVLAGFKRCTGDYICQINADDWISEDYVSMPVQFLEENSDYQYTICEISNFNGKETKTAPFWHAREASDNLTIEDFVLHAVSVANSRLMIRRHYFDKAGVLKDFYIGSPASQEAQTFLPLIALKGKHKYFTKPMYFFDVTQAGDQISVQNTLDGITAFTFGYTETVEATIKNLSLDKVKREYYLNINRVICLLKILGFCCTHKIGVENNEAVGYAMEVRKLLSNYFNLREDTSIECILNFAYPIRQVITNKILGIDIEIIPPIADCRNVIACGCLGKIGKVAMAMLPQIEIKPNVYWDSVATGVESYDGIPITKPDYSSIQPDDVAVVLVAKKNYRDEITKELKEVGCQNIYDYSQVVNTFCQSLFYDTW